MTDSLEKVDPPFKTTILTSLNKDVLDELSKVLPSSQKHELNWDYHIMAARIVDEMKLDPKKGN